MSTTQPTRVPSSVIADTERRTPGPASPSAPEPRPAASAGYRPRSWRYPMGLFQALLPLDDRPVAGPQPGAGDAGFGPTYGNRLAWERRFPGFGPARRGETGCRDCLA
jgi:hypothetical protein